MTDWIYCDDRMPGIEGEYLCMLCFRPKNIIYQGICEYAGKLWLAQASDMTDEVYAWQPLPEPAPVREKK